jgi:predicted phage tail protein
MEQQRRRRRAGLFAATPGFVLIALSVYAFARGGAVVLGVWAAVLGVALAALGISLIARAGRR